MLLAPAPLPGTTKSRILDVVVSTESESEPNTLCETVYRATELINHQEIQGNPPAPGARYTITLTVRLFTLLFNVKLASLTLSERLCKICSSLYNLKGGSIIVLASAMRFV